MTFTIDITHFTLAALPSVGIAASRCKPQGRPQPNAAWHLDPASGRPALRWTLQADRDVGARRMPWGGAPCAF